MTSEFDADTALEPAGEHRWRGVVPGSWSIGLGINGGFFAALATRAAERAAGLPARSLTVHYLAAPQADAPVEVQATIGRQGRSTAFLRLDFVQEQLVATALAVCAAWREDAPAFADAPPPAVPPVEECEYVRPGTSATPPLIAKYDMHVAVDPQARPARVDGWVRTADPRPCDDVLVAALTDAFLPPAFIRMAPERVFVPTLELTIHFRGRPPAGEHPYVMGSFTSRTAAGGVVEEDGELWSADGVLLAQSRQLAIMRRP